MCRKQLLTRSPLLTLPPGPANENLKSRTYLDLIHITDSVVELDRSTFLHASIASLILRKRGDPAWAWRHACSNGSAASGSGHCICELVDASLLLLMHSLLLLASGFERR